jgi:CDP-paratose 2-epimerase
MKESFNVILHLAGQVAVTTSVTNPREDFDVNALGTFNMLEAARKASKPPLFLYSSTNKVYGGLESFSVKEEGDQYVFTEAKEGVSEEAPLDFHSPYGCSKGAADQYVRDYARIYGLKTIVFRQSCIYGSHQMGIEDQGWVAWFMIAAILGKPITIYGNGKQVRDVLSVDDLVEVYTSAIDHIDRIAGKIYNIGGGAKNALSLLRFLDHLKNNLGLSVSPSFAATRPGDQPIFISNNALAKKDFGWEPKIGTEEGFRTLFAWLTENRTLIEGLYR